MGEENSKSKDMSNKMMDNPDKMAVDFMDDKIREAIKQGDPEKIRMLFRATELLGRAIELGNVVKLGETADSDKEFSNKIMVYSGKALKRLKSELAFMQITSTLWNK